MTIAVYLAFLLVNSSVFPLLFLKLNKQDTNIKVFGYGVPCPPPPSMIDCCMVAFAQIVFVTFDSLLSERLRISMLSAQV